MRHQFVLALARSFDSLQTRKLGYWKLMLRDGLSLYFVRFFLSPSNQIQIQKINLRGSFSIDYLGRQYDQRFILVHREALWSR
jgi:hypothetical protein